MKKVLMVVALGLFPAGLVACAQPTAPAPQASEETPYKGPGRGGDWRGNASSFPYQR